MLDLIPIIGLSLSLLTTIFNGVIFILIKFNDLKHLEISVKELKLTVKENSDKVDKLSERIARIEGKISIEE